MKNLLAILVLVFASGVAFGQLTAAAPGAKGDVAVPVFNNQTFDFGKIKQNVPVTHEFTFTNKGPVPMVITNVQASCGCTTPNWTRDPIMPGGQGFIKATYNAASPGGFNKSVTVTANVEGGLLQLFIKGEVVADTQPQ